MTRGKPVEGSGYRLGLGVLGLVAVLALAAAPLVAPTERVTRAHLQPAIPEEPPDANSIEQEAIRGEMTLAEVEAATGVPCADLVERLGLPTTTSADEKLGRLRRQYGFEIQQVRQVISDYKTGDDQTK